ncbi:MAG: 30S ribosomal protein S17 [Nitrospirae bacterium]|nr:MAG: 30S ribosomal protein S17 [Nitrospirota bacterium]
MTGRKPARVLVGQVLSNKMDKTVVVGVTRLVAHPLYGKILRRVTKVKAHDEGNRCQVGDRVKLIASRPISKEKRWRVVQRLESHGKPLHEEVVERA